MSVVCEQKFLKSRNGYEIPMIVSQPMDNENHPCIILLHGTYSTKNEVGNAFVYLANQLVNQGFTVIRFDFVGNGDSREDYIKYTLETAVADVHDVIEYAKELGCPKISLVGFSQGSTIAMLASNAEITSVVTLASAPDLRGMLSQEEIEEAKQNGYVVMNPGWTEPVKLSYKWIEQVYSTDVLKLYAEKNLPTLAIHGTVDEIVNPAYSKQVVDASNHPQSKVVYIDECNHIFNVLTHEYQYFKLVSDEVVKWFNQFYK